MQQQMRSRMMAQQLAMGREAFDWWLGFYGVTAVTLLAGWELLIIGHSPTKPSSQNVCSQTLLDTEWPIWSSFLVLLVHMAYACYSTVKMRQPGILVPLIPLSFVLGYQWDMCKGNKMDRILGKKLFKSTGKWRWNSLSPFQRQLIESLLRNSTFCSYLDPHSMPSTYRRRWTKQRRRNRHFYKVDTFRKNKG